jgi:hypothetical protein
MTADRCACRLHYLAGTWPTETLRRQPQADGAGNGRTERLASVLLQVLDLLRDDLNQLLKLLKLRGNDLQQLLQVHQLLLLKQLQLVKLLRHDLQYLQKLLHGLLDTKCLTAEGRRGRPLRIRREADPLSGKGALSSDSKRASCKRTHQSSSMYSM